MDMKLFLKAYPIYEKISEINGRMALAGIDKRQAQIALKKAETEIEQIRQEHAQALKEFESIK